MAWQTPKVDWSGADGVRDSDFNRIEGNILELYNTDGLRSDITVYVSTSGNDTSGNGTAASPYATITKALSSVPRSMHDKTITINIAAGTYLDRVVISGFTGIVTLYTAGLATIQQLVVDGCYVLHNGAQLNVQQGVIVRNGASFSGTAIIYVGGANSVGISVSSGASFVVLQTVTISNASIALDVYTNGRFYAAVLGGSNNITGVMAYSGGVVSYGSTSLDATTQRSTNTGGKIYTGAQASVPNY